MRSYHNALRSFGIKAALIMPAGGRSLTIPNQAVDIKIAITRFSAPSIEERLKGYYEEEGLELPNFDRMDKIERLQLLADTKADMDNAKLRAKKAFHEAADKAEAELKKASEIPSPSKDDSK